MRTNRPSSRFSRPRRGEMRNDEDQVMGDPAGSGAAHPRGGTRERIQSVALELFAGQGYEKASRREIAERLGVTKAALYYHFKSKEDIAASGVEASFGPIDAPIDWGLSQPR